MLTCWWHNQKVTVYCYFFLYCAVVKNLHFNPDWSTFLFSVKLGLYESCVRSFEKALTCASLKQDHSAMNAIQKVLTFLSTCFTLPIITGTFARTLAY